MSIISLIKALDLALWLNITVMLVLYALAIINGPDERGEGPRSAGGLAFARRLILGIVVGWAGNWVLYGNLSYVFWFHDADPTLSPARWEVRIIYLALTLIGSTMHIVTALRLDMGWWRSTALWVGGLLVVVAALATFDAMGLA